MPTIDPRVTPVGGVEATSFAKADRGGGAGIYSVMQEVCITMRWGSRPKHRGDIELGRDIAWLS